MSTVCVFLADGFEEVEALTPVDLLRRSGVEVTVMSVGPSLEVTGRSGIRVCADTLWKEELAAKADMLVLPGGQPGTKNLGAHSGLKEQILLAFREERWLAAICAAPTVLAANGCLQGKRATCYPGLEPLLEIRGAECVRTEEVVTDGKIISSRGAGTAIPFSLKLIEVLQGKEAADKVAAGIVFS